MKKRLGFVSNSSSASFICQCCDAEYDVESRGGVGDDWEPPKGGLCEVCETAFFICACGEHFSIVEGIKLDFEYNVEAGPIFVYSEYACPHCFVNDKQFKVEFEEWSKKIANPEYELSDIEKEIVKATHEEETIVPCLSNITIGRIIDMPKGKIEYVGIGHVKVSGRLTSYNAHIASQIFQTVFAADKMLIVDVTDTEKATLDGLNRLIALNHASIGQPSNGNTLIIIHSGQLDEYTIDLLHKFEIEIMNTEDAKKAGSNPRVQALIEKAKRKFGQ